MQTRSQTKKNDSIKFTFNLNDSDDNEDYSPGKSTSTSNGPCSMLQSMMKKFPKRRASHRALELTDACTMTNTDDINCIQKSDASTDMRATSDAATQTEHQPTGKKWIFWFLLVIAIVFCVIIIAGSIGGIYTAYQLICKNNTVVTTAERPLNVTIMLND